MQSKSQHLAIKLYTLFQTEKTINLEKVYDLALIVNSSLPLLTSRYNHFYAVRTIIKQNLS